MIRLASSWDLLVVNVVSTTAKLNRHNHHYYLFQSSLSLSWRLSFVPEPLAVERLGRVRVRSITGTCEPARLELSFETRSTAWELLVMNVASMARLNHHNHYSVPFPIMLILVMDAIVRP